MSAKPAWNVRYKQRCARRCGTSEIGTSALGSGSHGLAGGDHQNSMDPDGPARILHGLMVNNYQWLLMVNNG